MIKSVENATQTPYIRFKRGFLFENLLRRHVVGSTIKTLSFHWFLLGLYGVKDLKIFIGYFLTQTKVIVLQLVIWSQQNVPQFDVSMYYSFSHQVYQSVDQLSAKIFQNLFVFYFALLLQIWIQLSLFAIL